MIYYYLNKLDFTDKVNDDDFEKLRCVKRILDREFEEYNLYKLREILCLVDRLMVLTTTGILDHVLDSTHTLREKFFYLIGFKHFVNKKRRKKLTMKTYSNLQTFNICVNI